MEILSLVQEVMEVYMETIYIEEYYEVQFPSLVFDQWGESRGVVYHPIVLRTELTFSWEE